VDRGALRVFRVAYLDGYNTRGMSIDRAGFPFIGGAVLVALLLAAFGFFGTAIVPLGLAAFFLFFFRDPARQTVHTPGDVISPADGRVLVAGPAQSEGAPPGTWQQVSIFLSPMDVHVNRIPIGGRVTRVVETPGRFLPAYRAEAATQNERTEIWIERAGQTIVCRQVVGLLARRIVCRLAEGAEVETGQRYGIMKFGSRMDLYLPPDARIAVHVGDRVLSGVTRIARLGDDRSGA
jgi:phosphatidylserine decarboxylase